METSSAMTLEIQTALTSAHELENVLKIEYANEATSCKKKVLDLIQLVIGKLLSVENILKLNEIQASRISLDLLLRQTTKSPCLSTDYSQLPETTTSGTQTARVQTYATTETQVPHKSTSETQTEQLLKFSTLCVQIPERSISSVQTDELPVLKVTSTVTTRSSTSETQTENMLQLRIAQTQLPETSTKDTQTETTPTSILETETDNYFQLFIAQTQMTEMSHTGTRMEMQSSVEIKKNSAALNSKLLTDLGPHKNTTKEKKIDYEANESK